MNTALPRRSFLKTAATTSALIGLGDLDFLSRLPCVSAAETKLDPKFVQFRPEIEPLVRLLEDTPRTATVRALGAVDVLVMSRTDFRSMVTSFPVLDDYFEKLLRDRHPEEMKRSTKGNTVPLVPAS